MAESKTCPTRVISDEPSQRDEFGSHDRVASAICDLIRTEEGGRTIGLEGGWGSGKSTVIQLLAKQLADSKSFRLCVFDAWAHQGDPLRRTFLECIIRNLQENGWVTRKEWDEEVDELAKRTKTTESENISRLTVFAQLLGVLSLGVPVGAALFAAGLREKTPGNWMTYAGLPISLAPVLVAGIAIAALATCSLWYWHFKTPADKRRFRPYLGLLVNSAINKTTTQSTESPDPTSVEFGATFAKLMGQAIADDRKMILVLDNLDRVSHEDALSMWSALQTFIQTSEHKPPRWFHRLWVIIPYDRRAIRHLWNEPEQDLTEDSPVDEDSPVKEREGGYGSSLASSYLDKSLQIRFSVPPLVLSNWQLYLDTLLGRAFPDHDASEFHDVYRLARRWPAWRHLAPTPRDLKLLVNDIGAVHRQWQDQFPLKHAAYWALLRRSGADMAAQQALEPTLSSILQPPDVQDSLDVFVYNVEPDVARQLRLRTPIRTGLTEETSSEIRELVEKNGRRAWIVLEQMVEEHDAWQTSAELAHAAWLITDAGLLPADQFPEQRQVCRALVDEASAQQSWDALATTIVRGLLALVFISSGDQPFVDSIFASVARTPFGTQPLDLQQWASSLIGLMNGIASAYPEVTIPSIEVPASDPEQWIAFCVALEPLDPSHVFTGHLRSPVAIDAVISTLGTMAAGGQLRSAHAGVIRLSASLGSWDVFINQATARLASDVGAPSQEVAALLECIWELPRAPLAFEALKKLAGEGHLFHHLNEALTSNEEDAVAWCVLTAFFANALGSAPPAVGNAVTGYETLMSFLAKPDSRPATVNRCAQLFNGRNQIASLFTVDGSKAVLPFAVAILKILSEQPDAAVLLPTEMVEAQWQILYRDVLGSDSAKWGTFLRSRVDAAALADRVIDQPFVPANACLYRSLIAVLSENQKLVAWCVDGLRSLSSGDWLDAMQKQTQLPYLAMDLSEGAHEWTGTGQFESALAAHADWLIKNGSEAGGLAERWTDLVSALAPDPRELFKRKLLDMALAANGSYVGPFYAFYGVQISEPALLLAEPRLIDRLFQPILSKRSVVGLKWLGSVLQSAPKLLDSHHDKPAVRVFLRDVGLALLQPEDDATPEIRAIADLLDVSVPASASEEDAASVEESTGAEPKP